VSAVLLSSTPPPPIQFLAAGTSVPIPAAGGTLKPDDAGSQGWVLVVEDEPDALGAIVELLESEGFPAIGARNGEEALALIRGGWMPKLVLVDLKMPVLDGWGFCAELEADPDFRDTPVAIFTASASIGKLPHRRVDAGYFQKPLDFNRLIKVASRFCR
jgi:two-component system, chemotaxis family, chemotaxis protein CheY